MLEALYPVVKRSGHPANRMDVVVKLLKMQLMPPDVVVKGTNGVDYNDCSIKLIEKTNKMQPCSRIYYSNVS